MSYGYDEFESKVGQFIYTMVMYERLKEYLLERVKGRGKVSLRINLGTDKSGNTVFMDVILTTVKPQMITPPVEESKWKGRKTLVMVLTNNEDLSGDPRQMAEEMERLLMESLRWWHGYFGERDKLKLDSWKPDVVMILDAENAEVVAEIPVKRIVIPPNRRVTLSPETLEKLSQYVDLLSPITVRTAESGFYELITGYPQLAVYVEKLGADTVKARVLDISEEDAERIYEESATTMNKLIELLTSS